jgi:hypothetical protein
MRSRSLMAVGAALLVVATDRTSFAQSPAPRRQITLDGSFAGLNVGFAVRHSARTSIGASVGIGGNWWSYMALGGRHFAESGGLSYEPKDGYTSKSLYELVRGTVYVRRDFNSGRQLDVGVKASAFLHSDSSDDDPGGGGFIGLNLAGMWWQRGRVRLGSELDIGRYSEGRPDLGVNVAPILLRLTF